MLSRTTQVRRANLRNDNQVVVDRSWVKQTRQHRYEVLVTSCNGGLIQASVLVTHDRKAAEAAFDDLKRKWS